MHHFPLLAQEQMTLQASHTHTSMARHRLGLPMCDDITLGLGSQLPGIRNFGMYVQR